MLTVVTCAVVVLSRIAMQPPRDKWQGVPHGEEEI